MQKVEEMEGLQVGSGHGQEEKASTFLASEVGGVHWVHIVKRRPPRA